MALNTVAKFEEKMTYVFKNGMRNLAIFHQSMFECLKIGTFYRGILCHENEE